MKALSIKQPWAELIIRGFKDVENRSRRTQFRGRLAVHVSLRRAPEDDLIKALWRAGPGQGLPAVPPRRGKLIMDTWQANRDAGHVIGTVDLVDCVHASKSPWAIDGLWHWMLANPVIFARPVPAKGQLGLWDWSRS